MFVAGDAKTGCGGPVVVDDVADEATKFAGTIEELEYIFM